MLALGTVQSHQRTREALGGECLLAPPLDTVHKHNTHHRDTRDTRTPTIIFPYGSQTILRQDITCSYGSHATKTGYNISIMLREPPRERGRAWWWRVWSKACGAAASATWCPLTRPRDTGPPPTASVQAFVGGHQSGATEQPEAHTGELNERPSCTCRCCVLPPPLPLLLLHPAVTCDE